VTSPTPGLIALVDVMDRLRRECPWDREQTHESLARYLLEETYETLEAIERGDEEHLREELGDLLMQVYFHARIAEETDPSQGGFGIDDVARGIVDKLVRRHPHVFAGLRVADAAEVERNWEQLKAEEKPRRGTTEGIPPTLPALAYADKVLSRLEKSGARRPPLPIGDGVGERLLALVAEARESGLDAETELRRLTRTWVESTVGPATPEQA
jgi:XTP/dITP diphosphohydrolase